MSTYRQATTFLTLIPLLVPGALLVALASCSPTAKKAAPARTDIAETDQVGYPRGPWWRGNVGTTMMGVAHVLVAHDQSRSLERILPDLQQKPTRTRAQALARALDVSREARRDPTQFSELARRYSDDLTTAEFGGLIGDVYIEDFPEQVVDALGNVELGQCTYPVETSLGFLVLKRVQVRPRAEYSAEEILIGYDGSYGAVPLHRDTPRTLAAAEALARAVADKAAEPGASFSSLVASYSDGYTASQDGRRGTWDNYDRSVDPIVTTAVDRLSIGSVSGALLTRDGFLILKRTSPAPMEPVSFSGLHVPYNRNRGLAGEGDDRSPAEAEDIATRILQKVKRDPSLLPAFQKEYCGSALCLMGARRITEADLYFTGLVRAVRKTEVGAFVDRAIDTPGGFFVVRRERPTENPSWLRITPTFELPIPSPLAFHSASGEELRWYVGQLQDVIANQLQLTSDEKGKITTVLTALTEELVVAPASSRAEIIAWSAIKLTATVGPKRSLQISQLNDQLMMSLSGVVVGTRH